MNIQPGWFDILLAALNVHYWDDAPWCLDLYCGAGGAGMGYKLAGFNVLGVDIKPQPRYPGWFVQGDALEFARQYGHLFDMIHASPTCQGYAVSVQSSNSKWVSYSRGKSEPRLIREVQAVLKDLRAPYVIENVQGAQSELAASLLLCGSMFGNYPARHRFFEVSHMVMQPPHNKCVGANKRLARRLGCDYKQTIVAGKSRQAGTLDIWRDIMATAWMEKGREIVESIPPYFTRYIGTQMMRAITPGDGDLTVEYSD
jgi:site-specific DNA-cytosine methylase